MKLVYSDQYDLNLGDHVFPSVKYRLTREKLLHDGIVRQEDFVEPSPASDEDVALVHHREYIRKLQTGKLSYLEILRLEIPYSPELIRAVWLCAGGSILAARLALEDGVAVNLGGGSTTPFRTTARDSASCTTWLSPSAACRRTGPSSGP